MGKRRVNEKHNAERGKQSRIGTAMPAELRERVEASAEAAGTDKSGFAREALEVAVKWQGIRKETISAAAFLGMSLGEYIAEAIRRFNTEVAETRKQIQLPDLRYKPNQR